MRVAWTWVDLQSKFVCMQYVGCSVFSFHNFREFFHLVSLELVNPDYALYECVNGLYKPNRNSHVNPAHLEYFKLTGTIMAKAICDG